MWIVPSPQAAVEIGYQPPWQPDVNNHVCDHRPTRKSLTMKRSNILFICRSHLTISLTISLRARPLLNRSNLVFPLHCDRTSATLTNSLSKVTGEKKKGGRMSDAMMLMFQWKNEITYLSTSFMIPIKFWGNVFSSQRPWRWHDKLKCLTRLTTLTTLYITSSHISR